MEVDTTVLEHGQTAPVLRRDKVLHSDQGGALPSCADLRPKRGLTL